MIIDIQVTWTFATPPLTTPYPVDIYWRIVGESNYNFTNVSNGESGTANINILNTTTNNISDRDLPCELDIEGYIVPSCANNNIAERLDFTTAVSLDLTDDMQCRGIEALCKGGGIIGIIPDTSISFSTDTINDPITIDVPSFVGSGISALLPDISVEFLNPSNPTSTIKAIYCYNVNYGGGFDATTNFDITGFDGSGNPITMTPTEIITACGSLTPVNNECYSSDSTYIPFVTTTSGYLKTCTNNENAEDYNDVFINNVIIGDVTVTDSYSCCQYKNCKVYNVVRSNVPELPTMAALPITIGYIDAITGQFATFTMSVGQTTTIIPAIEDTIAIYGSNVTSPISEMLLNLYATYFLMGGISVSPIGDCDTYHP